MEIHLITRGDKWASRKTGAKRASFLFYFKEDAISWATNFITNNTPPGKSSNVYIHNSTGAVETTIEVCNVSSRKKRRIG